MMNDTPRAQQANTLDLFNRIGKTGYTIRELADHLEIRTSSARSRIIRCFDNGWLKDKDVEGPTGRMRRFFLNGEGKKALRRALSRPPS